LFNLRIISRLDLLIVEKILLLALMHHKLKTMTVNSVFILVSSNVMDNDVLGDVRP
jgi:hypothetical protein